MAKTEKLQELKEKVAELNKKLKGLSEEELKKVTGGLNIAEGFDPHCF